LEWDYASASSRGQPIPLCLKLFCFLRFPEKWTVHKIVFIWLFCKFAGNTLDSWWEVWKGGRWQGLNGGDDWCSHWGDCTADKLGFPMPPLAPTLSFSPTFAFTT
jgi:hypothetical protein